MAAEIIVACIGATTSIIAAIKAAGAQRASAHFASSAQWAAATIAAQSERAISDRVIYVERITAERATWRSEMREHTSRLVALVHGATPASDAELRYRVANIALRLNPAGIENDPVKRGKHPVDRDIHAALAAIVAGKETGIGAAMKLERLVALLKQVWEDSKDEARQSPLT